MTELEVVEYELGENDPNTPGDAELLAATILTPFKGSMLGGTFIGEIEESTSFA